MSLKVIDTDVDRSSTYGFLLVIDSNRGLSCRLYAISDNCKILPPLAFKALAERFPLEFCDGSGTQKTRVMLLPDRRIGMTCPFV